MSKLHTKDGELFIVYYLPTENYVGVTTNLHKRLLKHTSRSSFYVGDVMELARTYKLKEALKLELEYQCVYECTQGVRDQTGSKNPYARKVVHTETGLTFDTIKEASEYFEFSYSDVRKQIKNKDNKYNLQKV